jgi:hypothetical protein
LTLAAGIVSVDGCGLVRGGARGTIFLVAWDSGKRKEVTLGFLAVRRYLKLFRIILQLKRAGMLEFDINFIGFLMFSVSLR